MIQQVRNYYNNSVFLIPHMFYVIIPNKHAIFSKIITNTVNELVFKTNFKGLS